EAATLAFLTRRVDRAKVIKPADLIGIERLKKLRQLQEGVNTLTTNAQSFEGGILSDFYAQRPWDSADLHGTLKTLRGEREALSFDILRLSYEDPDAAVLALFSEHREWLLRLVQAYLSVAGAYGGKLRTINYFVPPPRRTSESQPERKEVPNTAEFFEKTPKHLLGVLLDLRGDLLR